jgi:hypothetical protein
MDYEYLTAQMASGMLSFDVLLTRLIAMPKLPLKFNIDLLYLRRKQISPKTWSLPAKNSSPPPLK